MSTYIIKGIVAKENNFGESDRFVTVISAEKGKMFMFANGARRNKSKLAASTEFLSYSEFTVSENRDRKIITQATVIENFYNLRNDIYKLTYAAHMAEMMCDAVQEEQQSSEILALFLNSLSFMTSGKKESCFINAVFQFKLTCMEGYLPELNHCVLCGSSSDDDRYSFDYSNGGIICDKCRNNVNYLDKGTIEAMKYIENSPMSKTFSFKANNSIVNEIEHCSLKYSEQIHDKKYVKLNYLKSL